MRPPTFAEFCRGFADLVEWFAGLGIHTQEQLNERIALIEREQMVERLGPHTTNALLSPKTHPLTE